MDDEKRLPLVVVQCGWSRDRDMVGRFLGARGALMWPMGDPAELRRLLAEDRVDLVLADSACGLGTLRDMVVAFDGYLETVDLPMVLLADPDEMNEVAELTARRFNAVLLAKPVRLEQLTDAVEAGLRFRERHRQVRDLLREVEASNARLASANAELERRRDESAEEARRKTRFLAAISHDIRTPVNALVLTCQLLQMVSRDEPRPNEIRELTDLLRDNAASLLELVNDLLDIARYDQGKLDFSESDFTLGEFFEREMSGLRPLADQKRLTLIAEVETPRAVLRTDRVKLGRVVQNLVSNAVKFTDSGEVRVTARADTADGLLLTVRDTGVGIPDALREDIFDEFAQLRNPERDRTKGTGLGLAICRRLVTAMGGEIRVARESGPSGSTFEVALPPSRVVADGPTGPSGSETRTDPQDEMFAGRVLVVDDHAPSREVMSRVLGRLGLTVDGAVNGRDAIGRLERSSPDLVLLDLMMPEMGGLEALRVIRGQPRWRDLPVVILTGDVGGRGDEGLLKEGATALLSKPLDLSKLIELFRRILPPGSPAATGPADPGGSTWK